MDDRSPDDICSPLSYILTTSKPRESCAESPAEGGEYSSKLMVKMEFSKSHISQPRLVIGRLSRSSVLGMTSYNPIFSISLHSSSPSSLSETHCCDLLDATGLSLCSTPSSFGSDTSASNASAQLNRGSIPYRFTLPFRPHSPNTLLTWPRILRSDFRSVVPSATSLWTAFDRQLRRDATQGLTFFCLCGT